MKKLTVLAALLLAVSAGTTAFASTEYDPSKNSVTNSEQSNYQTVLITRGDGTDVTAAKIVYVDQADTSFDGAMGFLLKNKPADDVYTIKFGGSGNFTTSKFAIGVGIQGYDTELEAKGTPVKSNGKYSHGFVTPNGGVDFSNGGIILVKVGDSVLAYPTDNDLTFSGKASVMFGVQIDEVEENQTINVYFRPGASVTTQQKGGDDL